MLGVLSQLAHFSSILRQRLHPLLFPASSILRQRLHPLLFPASARRLFAERPDWASGMLGLLSQLARIFSILRRCLIHSFFLLLHAGSLQSVLTELPACLGCYRNLRAFFLSSDAAWSPPFSCFCMQALCRASWLSFRHAWVVIATCAHFFYLKTLLDPLLFPASACRLFAERPDWASGMLTPYG